MVKPYNIRFVVLFVNYLQECLDKPALPCYTRHLWKGREPARQPYSVVRFPMQLCI